MYICYEENNGFRMYFQYSAAGFNSLIKVGGGGGPTTTMAHAHKVADMAWRGYEWQTPWF